MTNQVQRLRDQAERNEEIKNKRLDLPWVGVEREYAFDTEDGKKPPEQLRAPSKFANFRLTPKTLRGRSLVTRKRGASAGMDAWISVSATRLWTSGFAGVRLVGMQPCAPHPGRLRARDGDECGTERLRSVRCRCGAARLRRRRRWPARRRCWPPTSRGCCRRTVERGPAG
jgi:hypothetical protein